VRELVELLHEPGELVLEQSLTGCAARGHSSSTVFRKRPRLEEETGWTRVFLGCHSVIIVFGSHSSPMITDWMRFFRKL
jgi:hypothetical protein